jgi:hypothetical protein
MSLGSRAVDNLIAVAALGLTVLASGVTAEATPSRECRAVHGRYAVYANHDRLWIIGSKHLIDVSIAELDKELNARGWEDTVVYGDFTICAERISDPLRLTSRDRVDVIGYSHLDYRQRR